jgi:uncharacterized protein YjbI with pentapeptide repeats
MQEIFVHDKAYQADDLTDGSLPKGEYEGCLFSNCDFSNADLAERKFINCRFTGCNLSLARIVKTVFQDVIFKDCKMLGLRFDQCSHFGLSFGFENCILNHASFYGVKIKGTQFRNTHLQEADFTDSDLSGVVFENCDLSRAIFENTNLVKADFSSAYNYSLDPEQNEIKGAFFTLPEVIGLLDKYNIRIDRIS